MLCMVGGDFFCSAEHASPRAVQCMLAPSCITVFKELVREVLNQLQGTAASRIQQTLTGAAPATRIGDKHELIIQSGHVRTQNTDALAPPFVSL